MLFDALLVEMLSLAPFAIWPPRLFRARLAEYFAQEYRSLEVLFGQELRVCSSGRPLGSMNRCSCASRTDAHARHSYLQLFGQHFWQRFWRWLWRAIRFRSMIRLARLFWLGRLLFLLFIVRADLQIFFYRFADYLPKLNVLLAIPLFFSFRLLFENVPHDGDKYRNDPSILKVHPASPTFWSSLRLQTPHRSGSQRRCASPCRPSDFAGSDNRPHPACRCAALLPSRAALPTPLPQL